MADPFQPKFVDLVRNYTTTTGTGDFVLGPAVNGFAGIAAACLPGERFHYSCVGVDKPAEREVGRGTLNANGTVGRDPIGGTRTNFSAGTKSIALIAAAEWFTSAQALVGSVTPFGQQIASAPDAAAARSTLALGSAATASAGDFLSSANGDRGDISIAGGAWSLDPDAPAVLAKVHHAATRAALAALASTGYPAYLREAGREGAFVFSSANLSAPVAADTAQGLYVAPASDPTGASGAWMRKFGNLPIAPEWFGMVEGDGAGANAAANDSAMAAMLSCLGALATPAVSGLYRGLHAIQFGLGTYEFSTPIDLSGGATTIAGKGMGHGGAAPTRLKFYGCTGIRLQETNTSGATTKDSPAHLGADRSILRDLAIEGSYASGAEAEYHGVHARTQFHAQNVNVRSFHGDAWRIEADSGAIGGNACSYTMINCHGWLSRNGIFEDGNNTSASTIIGGSFNQNRQWGLWQSNFLGNAHVGMEFATNGITAQNDGVSIGASIVSDGSYRYGALSGQESWCSTNAPASGTDNQGWYLIGAGGSTSGRPMWTNGILVRAGGCIRDDTTAATNSYSGVYAEQDQGKAQIVQRSLVVGGMLAAWCYQNTAANQGVSILKADDGVVIAAPSLEVDSLNATVKLGNRGSNPNVLSAIHATIAPTGAGLTWMFDTSTNALLLTYNNSNVSSVYSLLLSGQSTADQFGTGANQPNTIFMPRLAVGDNAFSRGNARRMFVDTAAPASGAHGQGEFCFYRGASAGLIGWKCTAGGTPGTWEAVYSGYATGSGVGYATGAGGAITQATSKSTGVTLNKLSGQVTMNNAALASAAVVEFTVTNSQVAATDTINLNLASGAATSTAYRYWVSGVAAGSFKICVENRSGGSLSEALVLNFAAVKAVAA